MLSLDGITEMLIAGHFNVTAIKELEIRDNKYLIFTLQVVKFSQSLNVVYKDKTTLINNDDYLAL